MPDGEPWGLKSSFYLQNCNGMKTSKFTNLLLWGCLSGDVELLLQGDRMALPPRPRAALAVPGATRDEGDSGVGGRGYPALLQQQG